MTQKVFRMPGKDNRSQIESITKTIVSTSTSHSTVVHEKNAISKLTPEFLGRHAWRVLHTHHEPNPKWLDRWKYLIPSGCGCRKDAASILDQCPPRYDSPDEWFAWGIEFHNLVNAKLNKPTVSLDRARMLWRHERPQSDRTRAVITVANGTKFVEILKLTRPYMQAYADRCNADLIDLDNDTEDWGPMEKFRVWHFAKQYDEVLFVDADCVIKESCPNLFEVYQEDIVIHDDWPYLYKTAWLEKERDTVARKTGAEIKQITQCLNSGVVLTRKSACDIWLRPVVDIGTTHCAEQIWLEHQIDKAVSSGATLGLLDSRANWQWWLSTHDEGSFEAGLADAWIVHLANAPERLKAVKEVIDSL